METELTRLSQLLNDTLSSDGDVVHEATKSLDLFSRVPHFPHLLLSIASGGENTGQKVAAATYLKKLARQYLHDGNLSGASKELKRQLMQTLLHAEPAVLKVLVEVFRSIVVADFVENSLWPELVPELWSAMQNTDLINPGALCEWRTVNVLMVLQALIRPFQYFLNPKVAKEPVPEELELVAKEILLPVLTAFTQLVEKELRGGELELEKEQIILLICKCTYFAVRSYMPSSLVPALPSLCHCLIALLGSLSLKGGDASNSGYLLRIKSGKRSLLIFCTLITRHRKYTDKLMQDIINCSLRIVGCSSKISELDFLSERIISVAFDVIAHVLETGPGWRLVSPHFQFLLDSAIFPTLVLNEKDISEWEEDPDEYIRKNLPSELEEISGLREDLFTARKSAINLLGVIATSKGPPMAASSNGSSASSKRKKGEKNKTNQRHSSMGELLVLPFLSKFPIPSDSNVSAAKISNDYFGVLMAFSGLQYFLEEQRPEYVAMLIRNRVLPLYKLSICPPYLLASSNWILGELASCLQEELSMEVYSSLLKALVIPDTADISNYPVRFSAAGAVLQLLENDYPPPEWLPLLQVVISRINVEDEETSILFQLLTSMVETSTVNLADHIPLMVSSLVRALIGFIHPGSEEWPQAVQRGFATLAATAQSWDNFLSEEIGKNESSERWASARTAVGKALSELLQHAWLIPTLSMVKEEVSPTQMCLDHSSVLLQTILLSVTGTDALEDLKISELLVVWASLISDWHAWEESEDLSVFDCIKEVVSLHKEYGLKDFIVRRSPPPPGPPVPEQSIIEGITAFVSEAISQYVSATCRACACVHMLLHATNCETDCVKQSLVSAFSCAAFSRFRETQQQPCSLWTSLLLVISSCYLCSPDIVERILERDLEGGFTVWVSALTFVSTSRSDPSLQLKSEIKLAVLTLAMVIERLSAHKNPSEKLLRDCFRSLMEISVRLKELHEEVDEDGENNSETEEDEEDDGDSDDAYDSEDSEGYEHVETEEEFLERYAKAAEALDAEVAIEEGDIKDEGHEIELGAFEEVEEQKVVYSLLGKHSRFLVQGQPLSLEPHVISNFLDVFPECKPFFQ